MQLFRHWHRRRSRRASGSVDRDAGLREPGQEEALLPEGPETPRYRDNDLAAQGSDDRNPFAEEASIDMAEIFEGDLVPPERPGTPTSGPSAPPSQPSNSIALFSEFFSEEPLSSDVGIVSEDLVSPFISTMLPLGVPHALPQKEPAHDVWAGIPRIAIEPSMDRSSTLRSAVSDRRLPRLEEEEDAGIAPDLGSVTAGDTLGVFAPRPSTDEGARLALKIDVIAGPCSETTYVTSEEAVDVRIGRAPENDLVLHDSEVSGKHAIISWSVMGRCWQMCDLGSLNGTLLNGSAIGGLQGAEGGVRGRGENYRLSTDDIVQLGTATRLKISVFPREMLPRNSGDRQLSLSLGSFPRSLTMPKHKVPSFTSLLSPKINSSPSKQAVVAAASDELRLECCIASSTGRDHTRRGQIIEDVASAECPLHGSEAALGGPSAALFCVFDGHCGRAAADAAREVLPDEISSRLLGVRDGMLGGDGGGARDALHAAFLATDDRIACEEGCTATAILAWQGGREGGEVRMQAANVGDSSALLIDPANGTWKVLTEDHRLTNPAERDRLVRTGIPLNDTSRRLYGLNLARALGDRFLKDEDLGLSAEPHVCDIQIIARDQGALILVASDGLWDVMDFAAVASLALTVDKEEADGGAVQVAAAVIAAAKKAGTRDDVTALVVRVWSEEEWELRSPTRNLDDGRAALFEV